MVLRPAGRATSLEDLQEMQTLRPHTRFTESKTDSAACALTNPAGDSDACQS